MKKIFLLLLVVIAILNNSGAQGCSDAGFCTIHAIKNNTKGALSGKEGENEILLGFSFGKGEQSISYYTPYIEYTRSLTERTSVTGKLVYSFIQGELANTNGLGDLFLSVNHAFDTKSKWQKSVVAGFKIPFDKADLVENGIHLPMPYQTSLGTYDLVLGLNFIRKSLGISAAWQQPLTATNENKFLPGDYPDEPATLDYWPTNMFGRKGDVLLRLSYNFDLKEKFSVRPSLLGIYHLANDTYLDINKTRRPIYNSLGLTLNGNVFVDYRMKNGNALELTLGTPFIVRDQRPDGLTRSFVAAVEYKFSF
jgi:hypothetical protein